MCHLQIRFPHPLIQQPEFGFIGTERLCRKTSVDTLPCANYLDSVPSFASLVAFQQRFLDHSVSFLAEHWSAVHKGCCQAVMTVSTSSRHGCIRALAVVISCATSFSWFLGSHT